MNPSLPRLGDFNLGFSLNFLSGRGLLTLKDREVGPFQLKLLELEIPEISFPFDVTGGAERFKSRRCTLRHLVFGVDNEGLNEAIKRSPLVDYGFQELKTAVRDGFVEFTGRFAVGDHQADFTFRAALLLRSQSELNVVFYDTRVYGWLPVPSALLPVYLKRALEVPFETDQRAGVWRLRPVEQFLRGLLPRAGWKIPDAGSAGLIAAECARNRLILVAGPETEPDAKQIREREPDKFAVLAAEGLATNVAAEEALGRGAIDEAYDRYRMAVDDERGGSWARTRLLQIGAADPELTMETRHLAEEVLSRDEQNVHALLAVAAIAMREGSFGDAASRYNMLAELARSQRRRFDAIAAELAAAEASAPIDPGGALAAYERAAARARDSIVAHQALFELRSTQGDWEGAVQAGERLVKLEPDPVKRGSVHRRIGTMCRSQLSDLRRARMHFERALRINPDDPGALEGLAETYAARGEPARAANYIARLAEQAEQSGDRRRVAALNLRLGEIWERWLGDAESAAARYLRVLDAEPKNRQAQLRLAALAEARGDLAEARGYYEDVLAAEEDSEGTDGEVISDLVAAYTRLARVTLSSEATSAEAVVCLERAVELDPTNRTARNELARLLRERGEWGRLLSFLQEWTEAATDPEEIRRAHLSTARVLIEQRGDKEGGRASLERVLNVAPQDQEALTLIIPLLEEQRDTVALTQRLAAAAEATTEPGRRGEFLYRLAMARTSLGLAPETRIRPLEDALAANPYHSNAARELVRLLRDGNDHARLAEGLECLAVAATATHERFDALLERSNILYKQLGRVRESERSLREALELKPEYVQGWIDLANLQREQGQHDQARTTLLGVLSDERLPEEAHGTLQLRLAELARAQNMPEQEVEHLKLAMQAGEMDTEVSDRLVEVLSQLGKKGELANLLEQWAQEAAHKGTLDRADTLWLRAAELRHQLGDLDRAQVLYKQLADSGRPVSPGAALSLERLSLSRDDFDMVAHALEVQIRGSEAEQRVPLFERLIDAHTLRDDEAAAADVCLRLLSLSPGNAKARRFLAQQAEVRGDYEAVLDHLAPLLLQGDPASETAPQRRETYIYAASIAHEIRPSLVSELAAAFEQEHGESGEEALSASLGETLATRQRWEELLALRRFQLERDPSAAAHQREMAEVLYRKLHQPQEALPYYEAALAAVPNDLEVQIALTEIYAQAERHHDLGELLHVMANQAGGIEDALAYGLRSAQVLNDHAQEPQLAQRSLHALAQREDVDPDEARLLEALSLHAMHGDLANLTERSLEQRPSVEDERFGRLIALYTGPLQEAEKAAAWCERFAEEFAHIDLPWRTWVNVVEQFPQAGSVVDVLNAWAAERAGPEQAAIYLELAEYARDQGDEELSISALGRASEADASSVVVLSQLVDAYLARQDWERVLGALDKLAALRPEGAERDEVHRQRIAVALEQAKDPQAAVRSLEALSEPTPEEIAQRAIIYIQESEWPRLSGLPEAVPLLNVEMLLRGAEGLAGVERFEAAQRFFEQAFTMVEDATPIWARAQEAWLQHDQNVPLALWRIAWSNREAAQRPQWLRLVAFAELVAAGEAAEPERYGLNLQQDFAAADLTGPEMARLVYRAATQVGDAEWRLKAAQALEGLLQDGEEDLPQVLELLYEHGFAGGDYNRAVELATRLLGLDTPQADQRLEQALEAAGRVGELLEHLTARAQAGGPQAGALWMRVSELYAEAGQWEHVAASLAEVPEEERALRWGELCYSAGQHLGDAQLQVRGAEAQGHHLQVPTKKANWLRVAARVLWWELQQPEEARSLLQQAHELDAVTVDGVDSEVSLAVAAGDQLSARRHLEEGLAVLGGPQTIGLWMELVRICIEFSDVSAGLTALESAIRLDVTEAPVWSELSAQAARLSRGDLQLECAERAYSLDTAYEDLFVSALRENEEWARLVEVLRIRGQSLEGAEAAQRFEHAAQIAREQLADKELAVELMSEAVRATPTETNLRDTFMLGIELGRSVVIANLGAPLLERMGQEDPDRPEVLRRTVDALEENERNAETRALRAELVQRELATAHDKRELGRMELEEQPAVAAQLLQEAAVESGGEERAPLLYEAAQAWSLAGDADQARPLLLEAIESGVDSVAAHHLALDLLEGADRVRSAQRMIDLQGEAEWEPTHRAELRTQVAEFRLQTEELSAARELLEDALQYHKPERWPGVMEQVLQQLGDRLALANLWMDEAGLEPCYWSGEYLLARVQEAANIYVQEGDKPGELRALEIWTRLAPDDSQVRERLAAVAAEVGDASKFLEQVHIQLERAPSAEAKSELALRYAPVLQQQFDDTEAATGLLRDVFEHGPTVPLADALHEYLVSESPQELVELLMAAVPKVEGDSAVELLLRAARVAAPQDNNRAYSIYKEVVERDQTNPEARAFCLQYVEEREDWPAVLELLELNAAVEPDLAHDHFLRAADVAREHLQDAQGELKLVQLASDARPDDLGTAARLFDLQLALGDLTGAKTTYLQGRVLEDRQIEVALSLSQLLRDADRAAEAGEVMDWMAEHHAHTLAASDWRMVRARERGDNQALLREIRARLDHPATFDPAERAVFHAEAGRAALSLGERALALEHFLGVVDGGKLEANSLYHGLHIAREQQDGAAVEKLLAHSAKIRDRIAQAAQEAPQELRTEWLSLLGEAHERAGDEAAAVVAHAEVVKAADGAPPAASVEFLRRGYEAQQDWRGLVELNTKVAQYTEDPAAQADLYYQVGEMYRTRLDEAAQAAKHFELTLQAQPEHPQANYDLGLMRSRLGDHAAALPLLLDRVDVHNPDTPIDDLLSFAETLRQTESWEKGVDVVAAILSREPGRIVLHAQLAQMLEGLNRRDEAEEAWRTYADGLGADASPDEVGPIRERIAEWALERQDIEGAIVQLEEALKLRPDRLVVVSRLRELFEQVHRWQEAVELRLREAASAPTPDEQVAHYRELSRIYREQLGDFTGAALMLERGVQASPTDVTLMRELMVLHEDQGDWPKFMALAQRVMELVPEADLDSDFFARMARASQETNQDPNVAKEYYRKAARRDPNNQALKERYRELARVAGDWAEFAEAEEDAIAGLEDIDEKVVRYLELSDVYLRHLSNLAKAAEVLAKGRELKPDDPGLLRKTADAYALDERTYEQAAILYGQLLALDPLNPEVLRIRARLAGQMQDTDRAYGFYAALLALSPNDDEAKEYVNACRGARPLGPQRPITDQDRAQGLIHPHQSGPIEELFAPLARFAELTRPGDLSARGISESDRIPVEDDRAARLMHVLNPLGLGPVELFTWRGGGYACEAELLEMPTLLIGSSLADSPSIRQRAFLVARAAELYRTGHSLCEKLSDYELGGLLAALCLAIEPNAEPPGSTFETVEWAQTIAEPMTEEIRAHLGPAVLNYLSKAGELDIGTWRRGCLVTGGRVALLVSCDIAEAIDALMHSRGFDYELTDEQRLAVIKEVPEDIELLRFAVSEEFFVLRRSLGVALRTQ